MKKYSAVIFDLDGTLLDTLDDLAGSVNYSLKKFNLPLCTKEEVRQFVGNGVYNLVLRAVPATEREADISEIFSAFKEHYQAHCTDSTVPYEGVTALLSALKNANIKTAVVSNKSDFEVKKLKDKYFKSLIGTAIGARDGISLKPSPDSLYEALRELGVSRENAVYVGDSDVDVQTAQNAGTDIISVCWGFKDEEFLKLNGASVVAHNVEELAERLNVYLK